jgi:hypothetical protein
MGETQNMRLIHTSDWHLGRKLKGVDRTPEICLSIGRNPQICSGI